MIGGLQAPDMKCSWAPCTKLWPELSHSDEMVVQSTPNLEKRASSRFCEAGSSQATPLVVWKCCTLAHATPCHKASCEDQKAESMQDLTLPAKRRWTGVVFKIRVPSWYP